MRFITEFELENHVRPDRIYNHKERAKYDMGQLIQNSFDFKQKLFDSYTGNLATRWSLEIEAFPMDKWVEFKQKLFRHIENSDMVSGLWVLELIKELEFSGKQVL